MSQQHDAFVSPLVSRYASPEMAKLFGERRRAQTWRQIWLAIAKQQRRLGAPVSAAQIRALEATIDDIDFELVARHERRVRHDVMAHLHAWGDAAPSARGILHMGATSADIVDNADLILMREALTHVARMLADVIDALAGVARRFRDTPALGMTHLQPAQPTTAGKRACLWCADFVRDLEEVETRIRCLRFRGVKGATGTQAGFLELMGGDAEKVDRLERAVAKALGFEAVEPVTGQTYSRKIDAQCIAALGGIAVSVHKMANDVRLLCSFKELDEPFEEEQVGSSAMPYKRNPMLSERATSLARFVIGLTPMAMQTAAEQWLERTLDDSAGKRLIVPEAFLAVDAMLRISVQVARGLTFNVNVMQSRLQSELPFMVVESVLIAATAAGGDRQQLHERLRRHSRQAADRVKNQGEHNDLMERIESDSAFSAVDLQSLASPKRHVGLAPQQVDAFLRDVVAPIRRRYRRFLGRPVDVGI